MRAVVVILIAGIALLASTLAVSQGQAPAAGQAAGAAAGNAAGGAATGAEVGAAGGEACEDAARRYFAPLEKSCAECRVLYVRCTHHTPAIAAAYWVRAEGLRIAVTGPEPNAKASCELTARDLAARGRGGRCE